MKTKPKTAKPARRARRCRICGCTDDHACVPTCSWVSRDMCSTCETFYKQVVNYLTRSQASQRGIIRLWNEAVADIGADKRQPSLFAQAGIQ